MATPHSSDRKISLRVLTGSAGYRPAGPLPQPDAPRRPNRHPTRRPATGVALPSAPDRVPGGTDEPEGRPPWTTQTSRGAWS